MKKITMLFATLVLAVFGWQANAQSITQTLTSEISTDRGFTNITSTSSCAGLLSFTVPAGDVIDSISTSYDMSAVGGGWMSEQRSWLSSPSLAVGEAAVYNGTGSSTGTLSYNRTGISFANAASGVVDFELHAGRSYGGSGCGNTYNKVDAGTWSITIYHSAPAPQSITQTLATEISTDRGFTSLGNSSTCVGLLSVTIPTGDVIDSVVTSYDMSAVGGGWMSEQRSWLYSSTVSAGEATVTNGSGSSTGTSSYNRATSFANLASGTVDFELHAGRSYGGAGCDNVYNKVDAGTWNIVVYHSAAPTCTTPTVLTATNITTNSADLGWTSAGTLWDVEMGAAGFMSTGTPTTAGVATNPLNVTSLTANTSYDFYVRNDCSGSTSTWAGPFSFTTNCAVATAPFSESFDNTSIPNCWSQSATTGGPWAFGNTGIFWNTSGCAAPTEHSANGGNMASMDHSGSDAGVILEMPVIDVSSLTTPNLAFWYFMCNTGYTPVNELFIEAWDGSAWTLVGSNTIGTSGWEELSYDISTFTYGSNLAKLRFRSESGGAGGDYYGDAGIDDVSIAEAPSCIVPTVLTATNITATSADLGWTSAGTLWDVEMGAAGFTATGTPTNVGVANPLNVTSLTSSTSYDFYVRNDCGATSGASSWAGPFSFTTAFSCPAGAECASLTTEVSSDYSFTALGGASTCPGLLSVTIPTGNVIDSVTTFYDMSAVGGGWMAEQRSWLSSPTVSAGEAAVYNGAGSSTGTLSYNRTGISFANAASGVVDFELHAGRSYGGTGCDNTYNKVDAGTWNIVVYHSLAPSCFQPTVLTATNITATSADLGWTSAGNLWDVEWGTAGFTATGTPTNAGVTNPLNVTSLTSSTSYDFYVRNDCGASGISSWAGPFNFTTPCAALTLPWSEDFENAGAIPSCWTMAGGENWQFNLTGPNHVGNAGTLSGATVSGNYYATVDASGEDGAVTLTSPYVDISSLTNPQISFYEISDNEGGDNSILDVEVYDGAAWNTVGTYNTNTPGWEKKEITLSALTFTGPAAVRFTFSELAAPSGYVDDIAIDDVTFEETPSCLTPLALTVTNITTTSADLGWTSTAGLWDIEMGAAGFTPTGTPTTAGTLTNPTNAAGLTVNTSYDFYVRANCGASGNSAWAGPISFATNCNAVASFIQNFDSNTNIPSCWASDAVGGNASVAIINDVSYANSDSNSVRLRVYTAAENASIISPELSTLGSAYRLTFNAYNRNNSATALLVGTVDPLGTFTLFDSIMLTQIFGDTNVIVDFSSYTGSDTRLMVRSTSSDSSFAGGFYSDLHVDDMVWELIPACLSPTALGATNITSTTADLTWASTGTLWDIELDTAGFTPTGNPTTAGVATNPHSVTGLTSGVYYEFYIRADCGASGLSVWAGPYSFRATPDYCAGDHFYDNGGPTADYSNGSNDSTVICASTAGDIVTVTFNTFGLEAGFDYLTIYDGVGSAGTSFGQFDGNTIPGPFTATDSSGCLTFVFTSDGAVVDIGWDATITCANPPVGISEATNKLGLSIYPNPNKGVFTLNIKEKNVVVEIMNTQGQVVLTKNNVNTNEQIDLSNNAKGIYFLTVTSNEGVTTQKVIVQ